MNKKKQIIPKSYFTLLEFVTVLYSLPKRVPKKIM